MFNHGYGGGDGVAQSGLNRAGVGAGLALALVLFLVGSVPYAFAWLTTPSDAVYTGLVFDVPDHAQYWSWVTASRAGLFISNTMTPEPNPPIFMNPTMWVLARLQERSSLSFAALQQVWRAAAVVVLAVALVGSMNAFVTAPSRRRTAFWVALIGSGLGWLLVFLKKVMALPDVPFPNDIYIVEPNTFFAAFAYPYLALAQGLLLMTLLGAWQAHRNGGLGAVALAAGSAAALALSHPYDLITVYAVLAAFWVVLVVRRRRLPRRLTVVGVVIALTSGPVAVYYRSLTATDPLWQAVLAQYANAGVWTPPHLHLFALMGIPLVLALGTLPRMFRDEAVTFIGTWAVVGFGLIYIPAVFQVKLLTGWQFPLAILAAHAWHDRLFPFVSPRLRLDRLFAGRRLDLVATVLLVLLVLPTTLYLMAWRIAELRRHERPFFLKRDERDALDWLCKNTTRDDVALAPLDIGQFVPNYGRTRAFVAHWAMTNRFFERRDAAERFFDPGTSDAERAAILDRDGVTLVLRSSARSSHTVYDPATSALFDPVFVRPSASVFRYRGPGSAATMRGSVP
jgi:hypothetical protein